MRLFLCPKCKVSGPVKHKGFDGKYLCEENYKPYDVVCVISTETPDSRGEIISTDGFDIATFKHRWTEGRTVNEVPVRWKFLKSSPAFISSAKILRSDNSWIAKFSVDRPRVFPRQVISKMYPAIGGRVNQRNKDNPDIIESFTLTEIGLSPTPNFNPDILPCMILEKDQLISQNKESIEVDRILTNIQESNSKKQTEELSWAFKKMIEFGERIKNIIKMKK